MRARALPSVSAVLLAISVTLASSACARPQLPALALRGRYTRSTSERAARQTFTVSIACGFALARSQVAPQRWSDEPYGPASRLDARAERCSSEDPCQAPGARARSQSGCADPALCAWQRGAQTIAERALLPLAEEDSP